MPDDLLSALGVNDPDDAPAAPAAAPAAASTGSASLDVPTAAAAAAAKYGLDPALFVRLVQQESGGNPNTKPSKKGAIGLTQLMPGTANAYGVDPTDPLQNLDGGARYLADLSKRYGGDMRKALAAYNAGPTAVDAAGGVPNIPETQNYVASIMHGDPASTPDQADPLMSALGIDPKKVEESASAPKAEWAGAGITPYKGSEATLTPGQQKIYETLVKGHAMDEGAAPGSIQNPLWEGPTGKAEDAPADAYYVDSKGVLQPPRNAKPKDEIASGALQGVGDVGTTIMGGIKALDNLSGDGGSSEIYDRLKAGQIQYDAQNAHGLTPTGVARFLGQAVASAPLLGGAETGLRLVPAVADSAFGKFVLGKGSELVAPGVKRTLTAGASLATKGALEGTGAAALTSSASDEPLWKQMLTGAAGGATLGPVAPAIAGAGRWTGETIGSLARPLTKGGRSGIVSDALDAAAGGVPATPDLTQYVPGVEPTLGEAAGNGGVSSLQRVVSTDPTLAARFTARTQANHEARIMFLDGIKGDPQSVADLAAARQPVVDAAREQAFANAAPATSGPLVQDVDAALTSPEAQMDAVASPLRSLRDKLVQPPPDMTPAEIADFMKRAGATFGAPEAAWTPEVMDAARTKLGAKFNAIAQGTQVPWDDDLAGRIQKIIGDTADVVPHSEVTPLFSRLADIASTAKKLPPDFLGKGILETPGGAMISGESYQALTARGGVIDKLGQSSSANLRGAAAQIRAALDDALEGSVEAKSAPGTAEATDLRSGDQVGDEPASGSVLDELRATRLQYKNMKTAEMALASAGPDRTVTPESLFKAVKSNFKQYTYSGGGALGDVAEDAIKAQAAKPPVIESDPLHLYGMREDLNSRIEKLQTDGSDASQLAASKLTAVRDSLDKAITTGAPAYSDFLGISQRSKEPVQAAQYLQTLNLTDSQGRPTLANVQKALDKIDAGRAAPGPHPAKTVSDVTVEQLSALRDDLKRASNIDLGKARGSDTRQNLATDAFASQVGTPLALAGPLGVGAVLHHPLVGAGVALAKPLYAMKNREIQEELADRLLYPGAPAPAAPVARPPSRLAAPVRNLTGPFLPAVGSLLLNHLTGSEAQP